MMMSDPILLLYILANMVVFVWAAEFIEVDTPNGRVRGEVITVNGRRVWRFLGIPYATPPVGELRFKRPVPAKPWSGTLDALSLPNSCYQSIDTMFNQFEGVNAWNPNTPISEDCLYLNLWIPERSFKADNLTTLVWIYGGSFNAGTSSLSLYSGGILAAQNDIIVASFNYRLGPFGFLYMNDEAAPGNAGLLDQSLALEWVSKNINSFGGNKHRVSIFGESAGSASVSLHLLSAKSWDYFNYAIMESATFYGHWAVRTPDKEYYRAAKLASLVNCSFSSDKETVACLRSVDPKRLTAAQWNVTEYIFDTTFGPTVDGYFLIDHPTTLIKRNYFKKTNILIGANKDEGSYFLMYGKPETFNFNFKDNLTKTEFRDIFDDVLKPVSTNTMVQETAMFEYVNSQIPAKRTSYGDILDDALGDINFICPCVSLGMAYGEANRNVYMYQFVKRSSQNPWPAWAGVMHAYELEYVFGAPLNDSLNYSPAEVRLSKKMMTYWTNFAKSGDPNRESYEVPSLNEWPYYTPQAQRYLQIGEMPELHTVKSGLRHRKCTFWTDTVPKLDETSRARLYSVVCARGVCLKALIGGLPMLTIMLAIILLKPWTDKIVKL